MIDPNCATQCNYHVGVEAAGRHHFRGVVWFKGKRIWRGKKTVNERIAWWEAEKEVADILRIEEVQS